MPNLRKNHSFDCKKEVDHIFNDFPHLRSDTIFVYRTKQHGEIYTGSKKVETHPTLAAYRSVIEGYVTGSGHGAIDSSINMIHLEKEDAEYIFQSALKGSTCHFILNHELGHRLTPVAPGIYSQMLFRENAADAFAAIRHLQRLGNTPQTLSDLSSLRSYHMARHDDQDHLTTPTIQQIIRDSKHIDFSSLSPAETYKTAEDYAKTYTPTVTEMDEARVFAKSMLAVLPNIPSVKRSMEYMASTALKTSSRFSFQIGAAAFQPFLNPKGHSLEGKKVRFSAKKCESLRARFIKRARHFKLDALAAELEESKQPQNKRINKHKPSI